MLWEVGRLARNANLGDQLAALRRRRVAVIIRWGRNDRVIPLASAEALAASAEGTQLLNVRVDHNWLITDANLFVELIANLVRFRVYNGSNARFYNLKLVDAAGVALMFFQIGSDGGLLDAPVKMNKLLLGPGERADLVVDFAGLVPGTRLTLTNNAPSPYPNGPRAMRRGGVPLARIMQFTVQGSTGYTAPLPARLRFTLVTRLAGRPLTARRTMTLVEILDPVQGPLMALLNNRRFEDGDYVSAPVSSNALERWDLVNLTGDAHPIHLHFTQFQVLDRQRVDTAAYQTATYGAAALVPGAGTYYGDGVPPHPGQVNPPVDPFLIGTPTPAPANERGWKDTVVALPGQVTRILVPFGAQAAGGAPLAFSASHTGTYVWHCHILEHEDNDMMQRYQII